MFAHGFNIRFGTIKPSAAVDVSMIAPKAPAIVFVKFSPKEANHRRFWQSNRMPAALQKR